MGDKSILAERLEALAEEQGVDTSGLIKNMEATMKRMNEMPPMQMLQEVASAPDSVGIDMHRLAQIIFTATFLSNSGRMSAGGQLEMLGYIDSGKELAAMLFADGN